MTVTIYGFKACDTVKKARNWLDAHKVAHRFFDYRVDSLDAATVDDWMKRAGWEAVFNRNSTSFKELSDAEKAKLGPKTARDMILSNTNFIKRPVLDTGKDLLFGFRQGDYEKAAG